MRIFEQVIKDVVKPKLTITKDRITLKTPLAVGFYERCNLEAISQKIANQIEDYCPSMRGTFNSNGSIRLTNQSKEIQIHFNPTGFCSSTINLTNIDTLVKE